MELYPLKVFLTVANEKSFSRAAEKLLRTQPAISLAIQKLESDLQEKLMDRSGKDLILTDAGRIVLEFARRFENLEGELENALAELRDNSAGRLIIGANESTTLYLLEHIGQYRRLYPKVKVQVRRSLSSKIPSQLIDGDLDAAERHYRAATEGFARFDRPVQNSMCLGMVADFDERATRERSRLTAIFGSLPVGDYVVWEDAGTEGPVVTVPAGAVVEVALP